MPDTAKRRGGLGGPGNLDTAGQTIVLGRPSALGHKAIEYSAFGVVSAG